VTERSAAEWAGEGGWQRWLGRTKDGRGVRMMRRISSFSERPRTDRPRRLSNWLNPTGERKVHSLVDKVYRKPCIADSFSQAAMRIALL